MNIAFSKLGTIGAATLLAALATPAAAADGKPAPRVTVSGFGSVETPPDYADLAFSVRGEGRTASEALAALVRKRKAIEAKLTDISLTTGGLSVSEARSDACNSDDIDESKRLSTGKCAIEGYIAELPMSARLTPANGAGRAVALVASLGASAPEIGGFGLLDRATAERRAAAAALADARARAEAIAAASGQRLGPLVDVKDQAASFGGGMEEIVVTAQRADVMVDEPIDVALNPLAIDTDTRLIATFELLR